MATVIDKTGLTDRADLFHEIISALNMWGSWDHIITEISDSNGRNWTAFCVDADETCCMFVPNYDATPLNVQIGIGFGDINNNVAVLDHVLSYTFSVGSHVIDSLHIIQNNTT